MKIFFLLVFFLGSLIQSEIKLHEIDQLRSYSDPESKSIINNGVEFCNNFFDNNKNLVISENKTFKNFFSCKFSKKRNRFYVYMLSQAKENELSIRETCIKIISNWSWISDHMDKNLKYQSKEYLAGFYVENIFNDRVLNFTNNISRDSLLINNEIDNLIIKNKDSFTENNQKNNKIIEEEINKIKRIYKKIISKSESDLDKIIKSELDRIVRYKIFINDIKSFKSYSCNWTPLKGLNPYIKKESYKEFENI